MAWLWLMPPIAAQTGARPALVAGCVERAEIRTAHTLQEIAADRGHVAQLRRGAFEQRLDEQRLCSGDGRIGGDLRHAGERADDQAAGGLADAVQRQLVDVDQVRGVFDFLAHQIDQRRAAGNVAAAGDSSGDRILFVG
jgi:hypothetical protein